MGVLVVIMGILGGLCGVMGIITAAEVIEPLGAEFTWMFWFVLAAILLLACIAAAVSRREHE